MQNLEKLAELAAQLPEAVRDNAVNLVERMGEVIEGISDKPLEWRPGNLKLVQGTSDRSKLPKGANIGALVLGEEILETPFPVIPIRAFTSRQKWNPNPDIQQVECQSPDGEVGFKYGDCRSCVHSKFDEAAGKTACNKTITVLQISSDLSQIFTSNFAKSNYSKGTDWQKAMKTAGVAPYKRTYKLRSETSSKSKNVELLFAEAFAGNQTDKAYIPFLDELSRISGEDRRTQLLGFREYLAKRAAGGAAQLENHLEDDTVVLLDAHTEGGAEEIKVVEEVAASTATTASSSGTKYKL